MTDWQPIETLVRDGRRVLTWHDAGTTVANPQHFAYGCTGWVSTQAAIEGLLGTEYCETGKVTHWMPLPPPPVAMGGKEE